MSLYCENAPFVYEGVLFECVKFRDVPIGALSAVATMSLSREAFADHSVVDHGNPHCRVDVAVVGPLGKGSEGSRRRGGGNRGESGLVTGISRRL